jgi:hypothetical protein
MASLVTEDIAETPLLSDYLSGSFKHTNETVFGFDFIDTDGIKKTMNYERVEDFFNDLIKPDILNLLSFEFITENILKARKFAEQIKHGKNTDIWADTISKTSPRMKKKILIQLIEKKVIPVLESRQAELESWKIADERERNRPKREKQKKRKKTKKLRKRFPPTQKNIKQATKIQAAMRGKRVRSPPPSENPQLDFQNLLLKTRGDLRDYKNMKGGFVPINIPSIFKQRVEEKTTHIMQNYDNIHDLIYLLRGSMNSASKEIFDNGEREFEILIQNEEGKKEPDYRLLNQLVLNHSRFVAGAIVLQDFYEQNAMGRLHEYLDIYSFANSWLLAKKYSPKRLREGGRKRKKRRTRKKSKSRKKRKRYSMSCKSKKRKNKKTKRRR